MGRKEVSPELKKEKLTIALPKWMINQLRKKDNYNKFIQDILSIYIKKDD